MIISIKAAKIKQKNDYFDKIAIIKAKKMIISIK
jgi:hypothetical protein